MFFPHFHPFQDRSDKRGAPTDGRDDLAFDVQGASGYSSGLDIVEEVPLPLPVAPASEATGGESTAQPGQREGAGQLNSTAGGVRPATEAAVSGGEEEAAAAAGETDVDQGVATVDDNQSAEPHDETHADAEV